MAISLETAISLVSALAAVGSTLFAWHSAATAKNALALTKIDHKEKHEGIRPYLIDGVCWDNDKRESIVSFACSFANPANAPNTVVRTDLEVYAYDKEGRLSRAILSPLVEEGLFLWDLKNLPVPINLEARSTMSGWISFKIPTHISNSLRIDKYQLSALTSVGERAVVESYILRRLSNDDQQTES